MDARELAARGAYESAREGDGPLLRQWVAVAPSAGTLQAALCGASEGNQVEIVSWLLECGVIPSASYGGVAASEWARRRAATEAGALLAAAMESSADETGECEPAWFRAALEQPRREGTTDLDGRRIHWLEWGVPGAPPLVFVHGFVGHAEWWSFIAPFFSADHHCMALDLSGHGDSGWAERYSREAWSFEVDAVLDASGAVGHPTIVGHSMGGLVALATAARRSDTLRGIVVVDSPMRPPDPPPGWIEPVPWREAAPSKVKTYPTLEAGIAHFRLVPPQPVRNRHLFRHVASRSLRPTEDGWTWRFDPSMFAKRELTPTGTYLETASCPVSVISAEHSWVVDPACPEYRDLLEERRVPHVVIPDCHHHLLIDQPLALVATLRTLGEFRREVP